MKKRTAIVVSLTCAFALCLSVLSACSRDAGGSGIVLADISSAPNKGTEETETYSSKTLLSEENAGMLQLACPADGGTYAICANVNAEAEYVLSLYFVGQTSEIKELSADWLKGCGVTAMCAAEGGGLWLIRSTPINEDEKEYELCTLKHEEYTPFLNIDVQDNSVITGLCAAKGRVFVSQTDFRGKNIVTAYSLTGEKEYELDIDSGFSMASDGNTVYIGKRIAGERGFSLLILDPQSKKMNELTQFDSGTILSCMGNKVYVGSPTGAFEYNSDTDKTHHLFQWASYGLSGVNALLWPDGEGGFIAGAREGLKVLLPGAKARETVIFAVNSPPGLYSGAVIDFNENNPDYEVIIKDYSSYPNPQQMLNTDIIAGKGPDIIDVATFSGEMISSGAMMNLIDYIDSDPDISTDDFLRGPYEAMTTTKGELLAIAPVFYVNTFLCRANTMNPDGYAGVADALERMGPADTAFAGTLSRDDFLALASCCGDVDEYSQDDIEAILEYAAELPEIENLDNQAVNVASGKQRFMNSTIGSGMHLMSALLDNFASTNINDMTIYGSPFRSGTGVLIPVVYLSIPANASHSDGAWAFLKSLLTGEGTSENEYPIVKARYDDAKAADESSIEKGLKTYYMVNGQEIEYVFKNADFYELSDALLNGVNGVYDFDAAALDIVRNCSAAFFAGQDTAAAAAMDIISRLNIYFSEKG